MKKITLQVKITALMLVMVLIPVVSANLIFNYAKGAMKARTVITGTRNVALQLKNAGEIPVLENVQKMDPSELQNPEGEPQLTQVELEAEKKKLLGEASSRIEIAAYEASILSEYLESKSDDLEQIDTGLRDLEKAAHVFYVGSLIFTGVSLVLFWFFMSRVSGPIKDVVERLRIFQNESSDTS
ncbi:MAG TPA: hypothetical protein DCG57_12500, partial [Candidatus Riflebacteria bacterium]|nr:hypothetical protein [Candidatus Riflebacteria bacterium]